MLRGSVGDEAGKEGGWRGGVSGVRQDFPVARGEAYGAVSGPSRMSAPSVCASCAGRRARGRSHSATRSQRPHRGPQSCASCAGPRLGCGAEQCIAKAPEPQRVGYRLGEDVGDVEVRVDLDEALDVVLPWYNTTRYGVVDGQLQYLSLGKVELQ